jgi:hypothetical protein
VSLHEKLQTLSKRVPSIIDKLETEEATKNALVMPFIAALGYDVFDPTEVVPEFVSDVGTKKGEKVDYVIKRDDEVIILIEAKQARADLSDVHANQLFRYFTVTRARIAILTNGLKYQFFTDLEEANKMDERPFLELDLRDLREENVQELQKLCKGVFDLDAMLMRASDLKQLSTIRKTLERQFNEPDEEFVRWLFGTANPNGRFVQSAKENFTALVRTALAGLVRDRVTERLQSALRHDADNDGASNSLSPSSADASAEASTEGVPEGSGHIVTTEEELQAYQIVRAIVCSDVTLDRIFYRDAQSYFSVILDDNNRKTICRLHFNGQKRKYIGLFDADKKETKYPIENVDDIYKLADVLRETVRRFVQVAA